MNGKRNVWLAAALLIVFAITRWPGLMPPNFSAAYALFFCAGLFFPLRIAWWLPLTAMLTTDVVLNVFYYHVAPVGTFMLVNYAGYAVLLLLGRLLHRRKNVLMALLGSLIGAVLFYLVTNTLSWIELPYVKSFAGWLRAMTIGLDGLPPTWEFFRNTLMSSALFTALFAAAFKYSEHLESAAEKKAAEATANEDEPSAEPEESKA